MANQDPGPGTVGKPTGTTRWTFLTNHAHVLVIIARHPQSTLREVAARVEITERATQKIVADLEAAGYLTRPRHGRRNSYTLATGHDVDELPEILLAAPRQNQNR